MTTIYLIRHAEAEGNLYRRIQGHYDSQITIHGEQQIDALAERFRDIHIDALYSSDLTRTKRTAGAILKYHPELTLQTTPRLREVNMGVWEDRPWGDVELEDPEQLHNFSYDPENWAIPGCERFSQLAARIQSAIRDLAKRHDGQTIAVVSHGMAIRTLVASVKGIPSADVRQIPHGDNTAVTLLHVAEDDIQVAYFNDNSHLTEEISTFARQSWWKGSSGSDLNNLRFEQMDPDEERELYLRCYADAWSASHGSAAGFEPEVYLECAKAHVREDPRALMKVIRGDEFAGLIELNTKRGASEGVGWISLCYMAPEHRGQRLAVQLVGHAVSVYRSLGRRVLRLHVSESNTRAIDFYTHYGFRRIGADEGVCGRLLLMEKDI
jgi:probable phosphoglycerate mutase